MKDRIIYALGFFDGVHLGHQSLLTACGKLAEETGAKAGVVTFDAHPETLVLGKSPALINTPADRERLLTQYGAETIVTLPFDKKLMEMPWQDFLALLMENYGAVGFVCGADFRFGHKGEGNTQKLQEACKKYAIPCIVLPEQTLEGSKISSTRIRSLLEQGDAETANRLLGHPHIFTGTVMPGRQLGRTIGIPTANLLPPEGLAIPKFGVYACLALVDGRKYMAVTNVGMRPTVGGHHVTVEPWLLDFEGDLYGKDLTLEFYKFLRPEQKFPDLPSLRQEILQNGEQVRKIFEKS